MPCICRFSSYIFIEIFTIHKATLNHLFEPSFSQIKWKLCTNCFSYNQEYYSIMQPFVKNTRVNFVSWKFYFKIHSDCVWLFYRLFSEVDSEEAERPYKSNWSAHFHTKGNQKSKTYIEIPASKMVKSTFAMVLLLGIVCTVVMAQKYPVKFDQVNIETVLSNDRVLSNYIKCLLDKGACTREGRELKSKCHFTINLLNWTTCNECVCGDIQALSLSSNRSCCFSYFS